jgi:hypothetical protein
MNVNKSRDNNSLSHSGGAQSSTNNGRKIQAAPHRNAKQRKSVSPVTVAPTIAKTRPEREGIANTRNALVEVCATNHSLTLPATQPLQPP